MKAVFVGGGSHRLVSILRGALAQPGIFENGEIVLVDLNVQRAEAVGRIVQKTPEFRRGSAKLSWTASLDEALPGADVVSVILMAGSPLSFSLGNAVSMKHGFLGSDNVSQNGALLAVKGAPILLEIARKMERHCPDAWLLDFANPVAVLSGMINRHTKIKALGVCAGFTNHQWDLSRILGKDEPCPGYDVEVAGINHLSFIVDGFVNGRDLFAELDRVLADDWKMAQLQPYWSEWEKKNITRSVTNLVRFYRELGVLIFSTEGDGMMHLYYDVNFRNTVPEKLPGREQIEIGVAAKGKQRAEANREFESHVTRELDDAFWSAQPANSVFALSRNDVFVLALRGIAGVEPVKIATSRLNHGAIEGFPDDAVVEYSQVLYKDRIRPSGRFKVPDIVHGLISGIAVHQTMLGDACATGDPKLLAHALLAYPVRPFEPASKALYRELIEINRNEIPASLRTADDYLK